MNISPTKEATQLEQRTFINRSVGKDYPDSPEWDYYSQLSSDSLEGESLGSDDWEPQRDHRGLRSRRLRNSLVSNGLGHLVCPLSVETLAKWSRKWFMESSMRR
jgi:hypothetical protein